ncbi:MAG: alpha/beta hydrolase [Proteobacteria bacterium]|nr:alpha/beta hydrolase [Pseudomonadota bacterium]
MIARAALLAELVVVMLVGQARAALRRITKGPARAGWTWQVELIAAGMQAIMMRSKRRGVPWLRAVLDLAPTPAPFGKRVRTEDIDAGGVRARWFVPLGGPAPTRTIIYCHGGGFVIGSPRTTHAELMAGLAVLAEARVLGVEYRLAPEHRFPAAHDDALAAVRWLYAQGADPAQVALGGDSAGGNLAAATLCSLRDAGDPLPAAAVLFCPWVDLLAAGGSMDTNAAVDFGDRELLVAWAEDYMPPGSPRDPRAFPIDAKLNGLPPLLIQVGGAEVLHDQVVAFAQRARAAGVDVTLETEPAMFHDWQLQAALLPEGARSVEAAARWLVAQLPMRSA